MDKKIIVIFILSLIFISGCTNGKNIADEFCKEKGFKGVDSYYGYNHKIFDCSIVGSDGKWSDTDFYDLDYAKEYMKEKQK